MAPEQREKEEVTRVARQRPVIRVCAELALVGVIRDGPSRSGGEWTMKVLRDLVRFLLIRIAFDLILVSCPMILPCHPCPSSLRSSNLTFTLSSVSRRPPLPSKCQPAQSPACSPSVRARRPKPRSHHLEWTKKTNLLRRISATGSKKCVRDTSRMWRRNLSWNTRYLHLRFMREIVAT